MKSLAQTEAEELCSQGAIFFARRAVFRTGCAKFQMPRPSLRYRLTESGERFEND